MSKIFENMRITLFCALKKTIYFVFQYLDDIY